MYIQNKDDIYIIVVSNALVADQGGHVPVDLVNCSKEDVYLQGGSKVGRLYALVQCLEAVEYRGNVVEISGELTVGNLSAGEKMY